ncbi:zinc finger protein 883-like [Trichoplusia ni]|uniref:Zinc finger protein 883-like n=1 Tax=Trichoplusia ni TaxID=7111 RepID=A0A7E5VF28_TRINI|nr:zinc finger protein 883-like [Trichoplusia ni]
MASPSQAEPAVWLEQIESVLGRKLTSIEVVGGIFCSICQLTFRNKKEYDTHYAEHGARDADITYTCLVCRKEFQGYPRFRNHCYLAHVTKNKHKCEHCSKTYSKQSILNNHIETAHTFKCASCKKQFSSKQELHTHQIIHKNEKDKPPYQCHECGESIESIDMCEYHIDEHCSSVYTCPVCGHTADTKLDAATHLTQHFGESLSADDISAPKLAEDCSIDILGGVLCNYCDELFKNRIEFDTHFAIEHEDKELVYSCNICGKQYDKYHLFGNHCYYHIAKDRFECTDCGKTFPRLSLLVLHTEAFHSLGSSAKPFSCGECGYGCASARRLAEHARVVHATSRLRCARCGRECGSLRELLRHAREHRPPPCACCRACGLQLSSLAAAERHLDVHRRSRYACPVCPRVYHEKHLILKHVPSHFEAVLHVCKVCGKVYNLRSRLVQHSKTHSDLRAHRCTFCNKGFMKASHLQQHLNIHTGSRPYKCTVCPKSFASHPNCFAESDDSTMDSIDPAIIEKDWCILNENSLIDNSLQYTDLLPVNTSTFDTGELFALFECHKLRDESLSEPREYGPELDAWGEPELAHIDPRLTTRRPDLLPHAH